MKQRQRIYYSAEQRAEIWERWQRGESMSSIGRRFDRENPPFIQLIAISQLRVPRLALLDGNLRC